MIGIEISKAALDVIVESLPSYVLVFYPPRKGDRGGYVIHLDERTVSQLDALRGPGEGHSEVILRLAKLEEML